MPRGAPRLYADEPVPEKLPPDPPKSDEAKAEIAWGQFKAKKGWTPETHAMILYEFIKTNGLFAKLLQYGQRRK